LGLFSCLKRSRSLPGQPSSHCSNFRSNLRTLSIRSQELLHAEPVRTLVGEAVQIDDTAATKAARGLGSAAHAVIGTSPCCSFAAGVASNGTAGAWCRAVKPTMDSARLGAGTRSLKLGSPRIGSGRRACTTAPANGQSGRCSWRGMRAPSCRSRWCLEATRRCDSASVLTVLPGRGPAGDAGAHHDDDEHGWRFGDQPCTAPMINRIALPLPARR
jgi:hypothetical protein